MTQPSVELLRERLLQSFDDYHSSIRKQTQLLDELIEAVRREERARCDEEPRGVKAPTSAQVPRAGVLRLLDKAVRG